MTYALDVRDDMLELAEHYETVAALDPTEVTSSGRAIAGPRVPPGVQELLDADELSTSLSAVAEWTAFLAHVLMDECDVRPAGAGVPASLRQTATFTAFFLDHDDEMLALSFTDDLNEHLRTLRRLARRAAKLIRTGMGCQTGCTGHYVSALGQPGAKRHDTSLRCDKCGHEVPFTVWSSWPRARVQFVTVEHAAKMAGTTVDAIKQRAARGKWRRIGTGRDVRYHVDDVRGAA